MQPKAVPGAKPDDFEFEQECVDNRLAFFDSFGIKTKRVSSSKGNNLNRN
jgi:hypothetical protein